MKRVATKFALFFLGAAGCSAATPPVDRFQIWVCNVYRPVAERAPTELLRLQFAFSNLNLTESTPSYFRVGDPNGIFRQANPLVFYLDDKFKLEGKPSINGVFGDKSKKQTFFLRATSVEAIDGINDETLEKTFSIIGMHEGDEADARLIFQGNCNVAFRNSISSSDELFNAYDRLPAVERVRAPNL